MGIEDRDWYREKPIDWEPGRIKRKKSKKSPHSDVRQVDITRYSFDGCRNPVPADLLMIS